MLAACGGTSDDDDDAASGDCAVSLGFFGALTGDYAALGQNIKNGVQLAIDQYEGDCEVTLDGVRLPGQ